MIDALSFIAGMACAAGVRWAGLALARRVAAKMPEPAKAVQPPPRDPGARWQWHAMPCGTRLELGDTGYWIALKIHSDAPQHPYHAHTPEGVRVAWGAELGGLKKYCETLAAERAEFAAVRGWRL